MATQAEMEAAWEVYLSVDPQTWGISHMKAALEAAERARWQPSDYPAKPGNEIEAAATQIHYEMGCTITAARIAAAKALKAAERARWQPGDPRCDRCDNGVEPDWGWCPHCGQLLPSPPESK